MFCSLSPWNHTSELLGSTLRFSPLGLFFITNMDLSSPSSFPFCLQASRLSTDALRLPSRSCPLSVHYSNGSDQVHLRMSTCTFNDSDHHATLIASALPHIFIERLVNDTVAIGRIFRAANSTSSAHIEQWSIIPLQVRWLQSLNPC